MTRTNHRHTGSVSQNQKAQLANAYNELGKELSSSKIRVVGNYTLGKVIGEGAYGKVRMGTHRLTSTRVAIKQIPKAMSASLTREIHHHRQLHHPNVTQMYEVIATESSIWIVTELCCGGELYDYLAEKGHLSEDETKIMFGQLCLAVAYLHEKGIVHRDLKLENVLLDEKCRVKLGDFGFTREFDPNVLLETFCGTTGYASPEMLQGRKYYGPEVDVWSLGIILYCLLTGTLPFDDDDEAEMRKKIIKGDYEDPEWLSSESRDLIQNILLQDPSKRLTIAKILAHPWFTTPARPSSPPAPLHDISSSRTSTPDLDSHRTSEVSTSSESAATGSASSLTRAGLATPDDDDVSSPPHLDKGDIDDDADLDFPAIHSNNSEVTINNSASRQADIDSLQYKMDVRKHKSSRPQPVIEEDSSSSQHHHRPSGMEYDKPLPPHPSSSTPSTSTKALPPTNPRTPARTKRRSVSSNLSDPSSPTTANAPKPLFAPSPQHPSAPLDFASLLSTPTPVIFSTPLERQLLNTLSDIGYDTGQIVHSVLSDACDAAGAVWWMLKKKAEKRETDKAEEEQDKTPVPSGSSSNPKQERHRHHHHRNSHRKTVNTGVQTDGTAPVSGVVGGMSYHHSAPQLALLPATPTFPRPTTPPSSDRSRSPMLSPSTAHTSKSNPPTPAGSLSSGGSKGRKNRSGSVSIMQRATTALEAAGLVKKKSAEAILRYRDGDGDGKDKGVNGVPMDKGKESDRRSTMSSEDAGRGSNSLSSATGGRSTKSPKLKPHDDGTTPSTPPTSTQDLLYHPQPQIGSPWVLASATPHQQRSSHLVSPPTPANSPGVDQNPSGSGGKAANGQQRHRANILSAFRFWFNEDKRAKRKDIAAAHAGDASLGSPVDTSRHSTIRPLISPTGAGGTMKRRPSASGGNGRRLKRHSTSSRRSSSVNSRRSSGTSAQLIVLDPHYVYEPRRSIGNATPSSERGEFPSRPSSVRSYSMANSSSQYQHHHRKSPSASSIASSNMRTASPLPKYNQNHRRGGSGSSTRVVRQIQPHRSSHGRTNSTASSLHSPASSRPASFYEESDHNNTTSNGRTISPFKPPSSRASSMDDPPSAGGIGSTPRRSAYSSGNTTFIAQKRQGPFTSPISSYAANSMGRTSWKKSWGLEPPGWQTRTTHLPIEILSVSPATEVTGIRDVFSGRRGSINLGTNAPPGATAAGDESDWVDEDDDGIYTYVGGLGQLAASSSSSGGVAPPPSSLPPGRHHAPSSSSHKNADKHNVMLSAAPRGHRYGNKRSNDGKSAQKSGRLSPAAGNGDGLGSVGGRDPSPDGVRGGGRRQLPSGRAGPAFKNPIQEEDEEEEDE